MHKRLIGLATAFARAFAPALVQALSLALVASPSFAAEPAGLSGSVPSGVLRSTLSNGLRVVIVPDHLAPVVSIELNYLAGSNDAPPGFPGTAHALEHMMFRGSAGLDRDQLAELGALLGGQYNADTTETVTQYDYTVPADDLALALRSEALRMQGLTISQADWEQERGAIEQEVSRDLSSPFYTYLSQAQALLFEGTPYEHDALGTRPSFDKTDAALLRQFYERWYAPNNAILVVAGDVQPQAALTQVQAAFGGIARREVPPHASFTLAPVQAKTLTLPTNFPVGLISLGYRMPGLKDADFAAADILGDVLGSQRGAVYGLVPAGRALSAQFSYQAKADVGFGLAIAAFPKGDDPAPLLGDLHQVIAGLVQNGVPPELVEAAKRQELAQLAFENDSIGGLTRSWSKALAFRGANSPEDVAQAYAAVAVDDVNRVARQVLNPGDSITAILTPQDGGAPPTNGGFGQAESFNNPPDHPVTLPDWATATLAALHVPDPMPAPTVSMLPNGLRLIVQPEHVSHTVSVYGQIREVTDTQEPPGQEGVASLTSQLFGYGTLAMDRLTYRKAVDDIAATARAGSGFSLKVLTPQFGPGMQLLAQNELHPAFLSDQFPTAAFKLVRGQLAQRVSGQLQTPSYLFGRAVEKATVPPGDPTLRQATPETVLALQPDAVRAFYKAAFRPDLATIVVIGDITPDEARQVVATTFGGWEASGPKPDIDLPPVGASTASRARVPDPSSLQESVTLSQTIGLPVANPERYTLMLGNVILGSGFSSRLYRDLRVKTGYVYSVSSSMDWTRTRSDYSVSFGADGDNADRARALVLRDIKDMQDTPVSDAELMRAKAQVLRQLAMSGASVPAIAGLYLRLVDLGLPLDQQDIAAKRYMSITAPQIQKAFAAWLRPDDLAQVVKGPILAP